MPLLGEALLWNIYRITFFKYECQTFLVSKTLRIQFCISEIYNVAIVLHGYFITRINSYNIQGVQCKSQLETF